MFRVGQKVVCVEERAGNSCCGHVEPGLNDIGTITDLWMRGDHLVLSLAEFPAPCCRHFAEGWLAVSFRPVVEKKTDIAIFTAMLNPSKRRVDAGC